MKMNYINSADRVNVNGILLILLKIALHIRIIHGDYTPLLDESVFHVPSFTRNELLSFYKKVHNDPSSIPWTDQEKYFYSSLNKNGLIAIQMDGYGGIDQSSEAPPMKYEDARATALNGLCTCAYDADHGTDSYGGNNDHIFRTVVGQRSDKSSISRTTFAAATLPKNIRRRLPVTKLTQACGVNVVNAMKTLREHVSEATSLFTGAIDQMLVISAKNQEQQLLFTNQGDSFGSLASIIESSSHLEHFHLYEKHDKSESTMAGINSKVNDDNLILDLHTDAGLFLAFVPGYNCNFNSDDGWARSGLYVRDSTESNSLSKLKRVIFPKNSVGVLLGIGMQNWITTSPIIKSLQNPNSKDTTRISFEATHHAVYMPLGEQSRTWYGTSKSIFFCCFSMDKSAKSALDFSLYS
jgi:hypothetical protein